MSNFISCQLIHKYKTLLLVKMARKKEKRKKIQSTIQKNCIGLMAARTHFLSILLFYRQGQLYIFFECQY